MWDLSRENDNIRKHGVDFITAAGTFKDPKRKIFIDSRHSGKEPRFFCVGKPKKGLLPLDSLIGLGRSEYLELDIGEKG
ncbi:BrnT family toxin [Candidatus Omnitrophota bacterium]